MSDHTELVKRLRVNRDWDTVGLTKQAADAIAWQAATIARLSAELQLATEAFRDRIRDVRFEVARLQDELLQSMSPQFDDGQMIAEHGGRGQVAP